jgi:hypothetical protein
MLDRTHTQGPSRDVPNSTNPDPFGSSRSEFAEVGPDCDPVHVVLPDHEGTWILKSVRDLLFRALEIGFRLVQHEDLAGKPTIWIHTPHHDQMFTTVFSSCDDEAIADAVCAWIADSMWPYTRLVRLHAISQSVWRGPTPFSPRLRQMGINAILRTWSSELSVSPLETVRLLNRLNVDVDDVEGQRSLEGTIGRGDTFSDGIREFVLSLLALTGQVGVDYTNFSRILYWRT